MLVADSREVPFPPKYPLTGNCFLPLLSVSRTLGQTVLFNEPIKAGAAAGAFPGLTTDGLRAEPHLLRQDLATFRVSRHGKHVRPKWI
jgi:hypothetical protein